jgi:hypothetical protein
MANPQQLIGGNAAPLHNDNLAMDLLQTGSILGQTLELEQALAERLSYNLLNRNDNILNLEHSIGYTHAHSADGDRFEKALSRMVIPTIQSVALAQGVQEVQFNATPQHRVPFVGETIKDDPNNLGQKYICTGHKYVLSSGTPTQIINVCVNCPWDVMRRCVYFHAGRYWNIVNVKELLSIILKAKIALFNNNQVTKYKQQHKEQFMFMNRRNQRNGNGMTIFISRVVMNLSFSSAATTVMDIRETRNQIGRLAWTIAANRNNPQVKVNSIIAKQSPAGVILDNYDHNSYEVNINAIDDDPGIVNRQDFNFVSGVTVNHLGQAAAAGAVRKYYLTATTPANLGNTANAACLFPANCRAQIDGGTQIPQDTLTNAGTWQTAGTNINSAQLRRMFSTLEVKVMPNQPVTIN